MPNGHQISARLTAITGPYELSSGLHLFTDWRFIDAGAPSYYDSDGKPVSVKGDGELRQVYWQGVNVPRGIKIVPEKPTKSDPIEGFIGMTALYDGGVYRSWSGAKYSESQDGFVWKTPKFPNEPEGIDRNSLFFEKVGVHGPGVFIDPSAPSDERYKMIFMSTHPDKELIENAIADFRANRPNDIDPIFDVRGAIDGIFGAVSPDGIYWKLIEKPFLLHMSDNPSTMYYDTVLKKYVYYTRVNWMFGRRAIGRSESDTFDYLPQPEMVVWSDLDRLPSDDLYTNAKCLYPDTIDHHFLFPTVYHRSEDNCSLDMMSSFDGIHWFKYPGGSILDGDPETFDDGCLFTSSGLVPLGNDKVGVPYSGSTFPHKYPRWSNRDERGRSRYAIWKKGRLACVEATGDGFFATPIIKFKGRQLKLNLKTAFIGEVRVEVVGISNWVHKKKKEELITGHSFDDCDPISGDHLSHIVTWKGNPDLGHAENQAIYLRFKLRCAKLYAFETE
ncbi:TPA: hypothetical protein ENS27_03430 [bacterium]|mgnify:CR=1 FL=1|nr:hypothetical protein [bacterium]